MRKLLLLLSLFFLTFELRSQSLAINSDGSPANSTALLDLKSTNKGLLPPRMTQVQRNAISSPATGLIVQCNDCTPIGPYVYNGSSWSPMITRTYSIGEAAQGGIVFWVDDSGEHGLVAATADQGNNIPWFNGGSAFFCSPVRNDGIKTGRINTDAIIAQYGNNTYAASLCAKYLGGGFGDWYLPSKYELDLLNLQNAVVGGFGGSMYWSSTENDVNNAWGQIIPGGNQGLNNKGSNFKVRAIRRF